MKKKDSNQQEQRIHLRESGDETSLFREKEKKREKKWSVVTILFFAYAGVFFASLLFLVEYSAGARWQFSFAYMLRIIRQNIQNLYEFIIGNGAPGGINFQIIRYLIVGLVGASLAACGALLQGTFRNVLAGPSTLGVQSGGTLGNMIYVLFFCTTTGETVVYRFRDMQQIAAESTFWDRNLQQLLVFAGCLFAVVLVLGISTIAGKGKVSSSAMILAGTIFSSVIGSFCALIQYYIILKNPSDSRITTLRSLSMGSLDRAYSMEHFVSMAVILIPCMVILALLSGKMNLLALGEVPAAAMGMNVRRYKMIMMLVSTLMTAVVTAYVGHIGFIGFMVPQITRRLSGPDFRRIFPASLAVGAVLLTLIYDAARVAGMTDSLNLFTSVIGSIAMLYVLLKKRGGQADAA